MSATAFSPGSFEDPEVDREAELWQQVAELDLEVGALVVARAQALTQAVSVASAAGRDELAVGDVMGTLRVDRMAAERLIVEALLLVSRPMVCEALESGLLGVPHARALLDVLGQLSPEVADEVEPLVLARAAGRPPARIRELARREALSADPEGAAERRRAAAAKRFLSMRPAEDGMAYLGLLVRAETALAIVHRAEQATRADDESGRTRDQWRADWIVDRVLADRGGSAAGAAIAGKAPAGTAAEDRVVEDRAALSTADGSDLSRRNADADADADGIGIGIGKHATDEEATDRDAAERDATGQRGAEADNAAGSVEAPGCFCDGGRAAPPTASDEPFGLDRRRRRPMQALVLVPVSTALGMDDTACTLAEYGPIDADHGRLLLADAELRKVCVDQLTGQVLHVEESVVRPVADRARVEQLRRVERSRPASHWSDLAAGPPPGPGEAPPPVRAQLDPPPERTLERVPPDDPVPDGLPDWPQRQALAEAVRAALLTMVQAPSYAPQVPEAQYRPSAGLSRTVKIAYPRCDFPCCSVPSRGCDDEHTVAWPRGTNSLDTLRPRSRWCHRAKQAGWTPSPLPDGATLWSAPSGRTYLNPAEHGPLSPLRIGVRLALPRPPARRDTDPDDPWFRTPDALTAPLVGLPAAAAPARRPAAGPAARAADRADPAGDQTCCCGRPGCHDIPVRPGTLSWLFRRRDMPPPDPSEPLPF